MADKRVQAVADTLKGVGKGFDKPFYKRHCDDEFCDEIRVKVVPRFKTSGLSGDEWRTSVRIQLVRKGFVYAERGVSNMHNALLMLGEFFVRSHEPMPVEAIEHEKNLCDQPGCDRPAVNHYRFKLEKHGRAGVTKAPSCETRCKFCARHSCRGDQDFEDADANLELVVGSGTVQQRDEDESPAATHVIQLDDE